MSLIARPNNARYTHRLDKLNAQSGGGGNVENSYNGYQKHPSDENKAIVRENIGPEAIRVRYSDTEQIPNQNESNNCIYKYVPSSSQLPTSGLFVFPSSRVSRFGIVVRRSLLCDSLSAMRAFPLINVYLPTLSPSPRGRPRLRTYICLRRRGHRINLLESLGTEIISGASTISMMYLHSRTV